MTLFKENLKSTGGLEGNDKSSSCLEEMFVFPVYITVLCANQQLRSVWIS